VRELYLHVEVDFLGFAFFAGFTEESGDQTEKGGFVGENASDAGAAFEFLVDAFERIGGSQASLMCGWQSEVKPWGKFSSNHAASLGAE
jgi:hypothetical protein